MNKAFESYAPKEGFYMRFANGHGVSVIWHDGAYANGGVTTCEVMCPVGLDGQPHNFEDDSVIGHVTPDALLKVMVATAALPRKEMHMEWYMPEDWKPRKEAT